MSIEKVAVLAVMLSISWFLVGWSIGYKEGVKDGFNRGKAAGMRTARDIMAKVKDTIDVQPR